MPNRYNTILTLPVELLSHTTLARIYWELEYTGYENMGKGELREAIEKALKTCKTEIEDDLGDRDVSYDFMESVRQEVVF